MVESKFWGDLYRKVTRYQKMSTKSMIFCNSFSSLFRYKLLLILLFISCKNNDNGSLKILLFGSMFHQLVWISQPQGGVNNVWPWVSFAQYKSIEIRLDINYCTGKRNELAVTLLICSISYAAYVNVARHTCINM